MQNLISLVLTEQDLADFDTSLATLRRLMAPMIALKPEDRRELNKMGPKSEAFCGQVLALLANNPGIADRSKRVLLFAGRYSRYIKPGHWRPHALDIGAAVGSDIGEYCMCADGARGS